MNDLSRLAVAGLLLVLCYVGAPFAQEGAPKKTGVPVQLPDGVTVLVLRPEPSVDAAPQITVRRAWYMDIRIVEERAGWRKVDVSTYSPRRGRSAGEGWVKSSEVWTYEECAQQRKEDLRRRIAAAKEQRLRELESHLSYRTAPVDIQRAIQEERIKIGMTREQAVLAWGKPQDINRTVTANHTREQWIYNDVYVYFNNGILTGWQD